MKRYGFLLLFLLVLAAPFALRAIIVPADGRGAVATRGAPRLVVFTPHNQDIRREFGPAFSAWHNAKYGSPVAMDFRTIGGTQDIKRQLESMYRPYRGPDHKLLPEDQVPIDADVVWGGGDHFFNTELKRDLGILRPIGVSKAALDAAFPQPRLGGVALYDAQAAPDGSPAPHWIGVVLSSFGICYNADLYDRLARAHGGDASSPVAYPKTWHDLTDPRLAGLVALSDPTHSASVAVAYNMVLQRRMADAEEAYRQSLKGPGGEPPALKDLDRKASAYQAAVAAGWHAGMGDLQLIAANARYFTDSSTMVPNDVGHGQAAAGMVIDFYGRSFQEFVGPRRCAFVTPVAATAITPDPVGILYGVRGDRLTLATRFVEFLLSREGQELWIKRPGAPNGPKDRALRRTPIRADLYAAGVDRSDWTDDVNPFAESGGFNQRGEWMAAFSDTRTVWAAAWIDAWDEMRDAYDAARAVEDPARRAQLLAKFADVPVTLPELQQQMAERESAKKAGEDLDAWNARRRLAWANRFRAHYRAVEEASRQR